ncbi:MAG TPA: M48 family metallopeptidase [Bryobacteraceae bacterium]|nr:M48 family metallopeptidase [Bryobacteraceae bacterium]
MSCRAIALLWLWLLSTSAIPAAAPLAPPVPPGAQASPFFNAQTATDAWLATVPPAARKRSDAYFEGGYWLLLWDFLYTAAALLLLLQTRWSVRTRTWAERLTRFSWLQAYLYWIQFVCSMTLLLFPLTVYEGFIREHSYGLSNQTWLQWLRDQAVGFLLALFLGGVVVATLLVLVKRLPNSWQLWCTALALAFTIIGVAIAPVYLMPLFNRYTPLPDSAVKRQILSLAHANGIPARDVYEADESRQSKRVSANVSGLFGTDRITLNDNLLARCSPEAVVAVLGHEMGHYVMHHVLNGVLFSAIVLFCLFSAARRGVIFGVTKWSTRWGVRDTGDFALLPWIALLLLAMNFVLTPVNNTFTRTQEYEADIFGLNAARQPDGEAEVDLLLGEYRKLSPSPLEEFIFFDHPSGRTRIYAAMRWKAENLELRNLHLNPARSPNGPSGPLAARPR